MDTVSPDTVIGPSGVGISTCSCSTRRRIRSATAPSSVDPLPGSAREQHDELLAAEPADQVAVPDLVAQRVGHRLQHLVTGDVPVGVVDPLEVVEIEHQHATRAVLPAVARCSARSACCARPPR